MSELEFHSLPKLGINNYVRYISCLLLLLFLFFHTGPTVAELFKNHKLCRKIARAHKQTCMKSHRQTYTKHPKSRCCACQYMNVYFALEKQSFLDHRVAHQYRNQMKALIHDHSITGYPP